MAFSKSVYCYSCRRRTLHKRRLFDGGAGLFRFLINVALSVVTLGAWLPVWFAMHLSRPHRGFFCSRCGEDR